MRIGLRHILPIALTVVYTVLIVKGDAEGQAFQRHCADVAAQREREGPPPPGVVYLGPCDWSNRPPRAIDAAFQLNLPTMGVVLPVVLLIDTALPINERTSTLIDYVLAGLFVPLLWFGVGRWCDRRLGLLPKDQKSFGVIATVGLALLTGATAMLGLGALSMHTHHAGMFPYGLVLWPAFGALVLYYRARDSRVTADH